MRQWSAIAALCLCSWLSGCASTSPLSAPPTEAAAAGQRMPAAAIDLAGRLSVRYQTNGHDEALHGSFTWVQRPDTTIISLLSPLGQTLAVITITPTSAAIEQSGQAIRTAAEPDALVANVLGWPLPIAGLRDWLQGFTIDALNHRTAVASNDITPFKTTDGWTLQYATWDNSDPAHPHPKRIDMTRNTAEAGEVAIRLVIDSWLPHQAST